VESFSTSWVTILAGLGLVGGLILLARGFAGYRSVVRVGDVSTSTIGSLAAGEVRISGEVEPAELTLVSLLQSKPCVYYKSAINHSANNRSDDLSYSEERSIGFRVRDRTGSLRVFPRGARFDAPVLFEGETELDGDEPAGLDMRRGGSTQLTEIDRALAVARLLEVHDPGGGSLWARSQDHGRRTYRESRLAPGDPVTIVGRALPFSDLADPDAADVGATSEVPTDDPEVAADLAAARASGGLADDPTEAWGNAAIPGFGIGRPVTEPDLDPAANPLPIAGSAEADQAKRTFEIAPETLVIAASPEVPLLIAHGLPGAVIERGQLQFTIGLLGAVLAIASAMVVAVDLSGGFGR